MNGNFYTGSNRTYGAAKRKRGFTPSVSASKLSRRLFFKGGAPAAPQISAAVFDKAVGRALKSRHIETPEQKYFETVSSGAALDSTAVMTYLMATTEGVTENTYVGDKVRVTKIEINAIISLSATAAGGRDFGKVSLFIFKSPRGAAPGAFAVSPNNDVVAPYVDNGTAYLSIKNATQADQFYIIKDWDYCLDANAGVSGAWQQDIMRLKAEIPINRVVEFDNSAGGTIADCVKNAIFLGFVGSQAPGAASGAIQYVIRVWYTDM